jgi:hypothetical protein
MSGKRVAKSVRGARGQAVPPELRAQPPAHVGGHDGAAADGQEEV